MVQTRSELVTIETEAGSFTGFLAQTNSSAPRVLVYHAWWGLTPFFIDLCRRLAKAGFTVFAPDLYDGKTAATIPEAEAMMEQRDFDRHLFIANAAVEWMKNQPSIQDGLGLVGFSMGGSWSLAMASQYPDLVRAVVLFYGSGDTDYTQIRANIQGHFGGQDEWTPASDVQYMDAEMGKNGIEHEFFIYPDAQHWFFETNRPEFRQTDSNLAWDRMVNFLLEELT